MSNSKRTIKPRREVIDALKIAVGEARRPGSIIRLRCHNESHRAELVTAARDVADDKTLIARGIDFPDHRDTNFLLRSLAISLIEATQSSPPPPPRKPRWSTLWRSDDDVDPGTLLAQIERYGWSPDVQPELANIARIWRGSHKDDVALALVLENPSGASKSAMQAAGAIFEIFRHAAKCTTVIACLRGELVPIDFFGQTTILTASIELRDRQSEESLLATINDPAWGDKSFAEITARNMAFGAGYSEPPPHMVEHFALAWREVFKALAPPEEPPLAEPTHNAVGGRTLTLPERPTLAEPTHTAVGERTLTPPEQPTAAEIASETIRKTIERFQKLPARASANSQQFYDDLCWVALLLACERADATFRDAVARGDFSAVLFRDQVAPKSDSEGAPRLPERAAGGIRLAIEREIARFFGSPPEVKRFLQRMSSQLNIKVEEPSAELRNARDAARNYIEEVVKSGWDSNPVDALFGPADSLRKELSGIAGVDQSSDIELATLLLRCVDLHPVPQRTELANHSLNAAEGAARASTRSGDHVRRHVALLAQARARVDLEKLADAEGDVIRAVQLRKSESAAFRKAPSGNHERTEFLEISTQMRVAEAKASARFEGGMATTNVVTYWRENWLDQLARMPIQIGEVVQELDWHDDAISICVMNWAVLHLDDKAREREDAKDGAEGTEGDRQLLKTTRQITNVKEARQIIAFLRLLHEFSGDLNREGRYRAPRVFISYRRHLRTQVATIVDALKKQSGDLRVWWDRDENIGNRWSNETLLRLLLADAILVIESPAGLGGEPYENSAWCQIERAIAIKRSRRYGTPVVLKIVFDEQSGHREPIHVIKERAETWSAPLPNSDFTQAAARIAAEVCDALIVPDESPSSATAVDPAASLRAAAE